MKKTLAIPVGCPPEDLHLYGDQDMTPEEITERQQEESEWVPDPGSLYPDQVIKP